MNQRLSPIDVDALIAGIRAELTPPAAAAGPSVDEVMRRVRHEVALRRGTGSLGHDDVAIDRGGKLPRWHSAAERLATKDEYVLGDFMALDDADFVEAAYRALLRRPPDESGFRFHLRLLREGSLSKVEVLAALRWSPEGEARGVHVDGLLLPYLLHKWQRKPLIGPALRWLTAYARLPSRLERQSRESLRHARESQELGVHINVLAAQAELNAARLEDGLAALRERLEEGLALSNAGLDARIAATEARFGEGLAAATERLDAGIAATQAQLETGLASSSGLIAEGLAASATRIDKAEAALMQTLADHGAALWHAQAALSTHEDLLSQARTALAAAESVLQEQAARLQSLESALHQARTEARDLSAQVAGVDASLVALADARALAEAAAGQAAHGLDDLYARFEERFRGSEDLVRERVGQFLPKVRALGPLARVVDLGCGRGEWLQLMGEAGIQCLGVDTNRVFLEHCRRRGLDVVESDAIAWLQAQPETSVSGITSLHLVEHLPFSALMTLLAEAFRVVVPGGLLLLETPNPENLEVATHGFYMDPTHRNPLPPEMLAWLVQAQGFEAVQIERLTHARHLDAPPLLPVEAAGANSVNPLLQRLHAAPDYAIVARRP